MGSQSGMHTVSCSEEVTGSSFDAFLKECTDGSGIGELMGGQGPALGLHHDGGTETTTRTG